MTKDDKHTIIKGLLFVATVWLAFMAGCFTGWKYCLLWHCACHH